MRNHLELGIDEAGRGPVLGPMIMAGVVVPANDEQILHEWGVADSKTFGSSKKARGKREKLAKKIKDRFPHQVTIIPSDTIDHYVRNSSLNRLEQETALNIISSLKSDRVVLDGKNLFAPIENDKIKAYNKADKDYISVAAASILAKAERDRQIFELCKPFIDEYGEIGGGGYANKKTLEFVKWYLEKYGSLPPFYRASYQWKELRFN
ncbi:MAG: hypothetical protein MJE63_32435 [Proteobacteria bacterium]|nr:hypothetical protein [Pseudomonadota bacterium]